MKYEIIIDGDWLLHTAGFVGQRTEHCYVTADCLSIRRRNITELRAALAEQGLPYQPEQHFTRVEAEPVEHTLHTIKLMLQKAVTRVVDKSGGRHPTNEIIFVDGDGNFRNRIATIRPYKGTRLDMSKPVHYQAARNYLLAHHAAIPVHGMETDDAIAIEARRIRHAGSVPVIVGVDKDLLQIPGRHFNPNKGFRTVSTEQGLLFKYRQCLTGDSTDNIGGCYKMGAVRAKALLPAWPAGGEQEAWDIVERAYVKSYELAGAEEFYNGAEPEYAAVENMRLVHLCTSREQSGITYDDHFGGLWKPPSNEDE